MKSTLVLIAMALLVTAWGCRERSTRTVVSVTQVQSAAPTSAPATSQPAVAVAAVATERIAIRVNGRPIFERQLTDMLLKSQGLNLSQQFIASELVAQEAIAKGIRVTQAEVEAEHEASVSHMFPEVKKKEERDRLFEQWITQQAFPYEQWEITMRRNVLLGKLAADQVKVTDEMVNDEFLNQYGRQVRIRHIEVPTVAQAQELIEQLNNGADFAQLAKMHSLNVSGRQNGGLLPLMSEKNADVPLAILKVSMSLKTVGQISNPVQYNQNFHILRLEEIIPPKDVKIEDVRDTLTKIVYERKLADVKQHMLLTIIRKADETGQIDYVNPILKAENDKAVRATQAK